MKSIGIKKRFQIIKPKYVIYKVTPNTSIRNYQAYKIASIINRYYVKRLDRCIKENYQYIYHKPAKISYLIVMQKDSVEFFFIVPEFRKHLLKEKITSSWNKVTVEEVGELPTFSSKAIRYEMIYEKEDALSLNTNKANNDLLSSTLNVVDMLEDEDKVGILYNFIPTGDYTQMGFKNTAGETLQKFKDNKPVDRDKTTTRYVGLMAIRILLGVADDLLKAVSEFLGNKKEHNNITDSFYDLMAKKALHSSTEDKVLREVINTQIMILSESVDEGKAHTQALAAAEAFKSIEEDNSLVPRRTKSKADYFDYNLQIESNFMSVNELGSNCITLPGKSLIEQYPIPALKVQEQTLPKELMSGYLSIGKHTSGGVTLPAYLSIDPKLINLGLTLLGPQGSGKTTYLKMYMEGVVQNNDGAIILDYIKNCELSRDIEKLVPTDRLIVIDLSRPECFQGLGFNEVKFTDNMTSFEILEIANQQSLQILALIDAINVRGEPLSPHMRRYLMAACMVTYIHSSQSLRSVVRVLENYNFRTKTINSIPKELRPQLEDDINALQELNEKGKDGSMSTKGGKIENILARVSLLKEDIRLKYMFNKGTEGNVDFAEAMNQGKVIIIKMPEHKFQTKLVKNILVTYYISKIWVASQIRGFLYENPPRVHCIVDEIFQAPTAEFILEDILVQARKYQLKFVFSCHYLSQLKITEALKASGSSFMLLQGSDKKNFTEMKKELYPYEEEDLLNLKDYHSLNLIKTSMGYSALVTNLYNSRYANKKEPN